IGWQLVEWNTRHDSSLLLGGVRRDSIGASAVARHDVLGPLDRHTRAEHSAKQVELRGAKTLTGGGGSTDGAMVLDEEERPATFADHLGHVSFFAADARELFEPLAERCPARDAGGIRLPLFREPGV